MSVCFVSPGCSLTSNGILQAGCALPEGKVGEIWVTSKSRAAGYWSQPEKTAEDFGGRLSEDTEVRWVASETAVKYVAVDAAQPLIRAVKSNGRPPRAIHAGSRRILCSSLVVLFVSVDAVVVHHTVRSLPCTAEKPSCPRFSSGDDKIEICKYVCCMISRTYSQSAVFKFALVRPNTI